MCLATIVYVNTACIATCYFILAVNFNQFQILQSYTLLLYIATRSYMVLMYISLRILYNHIASQHNPNS